MTAFLATALLYMGSLAQPASTTPHPVPDLGQGWILQPAYSDEFNEPALDTAKWDNNVGSWGLWSWKPENAWVEDGRLHLRMAYHEHQRGGKTLYYTSGIIKSKAPPIRYGYFEARIKAAPLHPGVCPAFWVYHRTKELWTEIDFVELTQKQGDPRSVATNTHVFHHPKLAPGKEVHEGRTWEAPWDPREGFHVYGCEWTPDQITWYIDGKRVASRKNDYWHQALDVTFSFGLRSPLRKKPSAAGFPTVFQVDYVRVWQKKPTAQSS